MSDRREESIAGSIVYKILGLESRSMTENRIYTAVVPGSPMTTSAYWYYRNNIVGTRIPAMADRVLTPIEYGK